MQRVGDFMTTQSDVISQIPGAPELAAWFGYFPGFHDAYIEELSISGEGYFLRGERSGGL